MISSEFFVGLLAVAYAFFGVLDLYRGVTHTWSTWCITLAGWLYVILVGWKFLKSRIGKAP